jgi:hypothetical protein
VKTHKINGSHVVNYNMQTVFIPYGIEREEEVEPTDSKDYKWVPTKRTEQIQEKCQEITARNSKKTEEARTQASSNTSEAEEKVVSNKEFLLDLLTFHAEQPICQVPQTYRTPKIGCICKDETQFCLFLHGESEWFGAEFGCGQAWRYSRLFDLGANHEQPFFRKVGN